MSSPTTSELLLKKLDEGASKGDVSKLIKKLIDFVKEAKMKLEELFATHREEWNQKLEHLAARLSDTEAKSMQRQDADKETMYSESRTLMRFVEQESHRIEALIVPPTDLTSYNRRFEDLEGRFSEVSEELSPEGIRNKLETLQGSERLQASAIEVLEDLIGRVGKIEKQPQQTYTTPPDYRAHFKDIDLSDQLDGVTRTFQLPTTYNILSVSLSSFPNVLRKNVDFTYTRTSITFTGEIDAATSLASGQTCVLTVITG